MLIESLKNLLSRPLTSRNPYVPSENRGAVMWEMEKCIFCRLCERSCPTNAITTVKNESQTVERFKCIVCGECVRICPTQTIHMVPEYTQPSKTHTSDVFKVDPEKRKD